MREMQPRNASDARVSPRLPGWAVTALRWTGVTLALGITFAWLGVYETTEMPFPIRVVYWTGLMAIGVLSSLIVSPLIYDRWMAKAHPALQIVVISAIISVPITVGLAIIEASDGTWMASDWWGLQYAYCIVISTLLTAAAWVLDRFAERKAAAAAPAGPASASFADRLPIRLRSAEIWAVSAEDHYLRIHTSAGQELILMRLADAMRELAGYEGLQTHRSWWVAKQGLVDVARDNGKLVLKLKSGVDAPVSRTYAQAVKQAGWL